jgi:hypothetical protein
MARWFAIPMQRPSTPDGRGTVADPWRVKYLREAGLTNTGGISTRYGVITQVFGTEAQLDALAAHNDVVEITDAPLSQGQQNRLAAFLARRGIVVDTSLPGPQLIEALFAAILAVQAQETPAIRASIFAELTA